jgi:hypothetical protein
VSARDITLADTRLDGDLAIMKWLVRHTGVCQPILALHWFQNVKML